MYPNLVKPALCLSAVVGAAVAPLGDWSPSTASQPARYQISITNLTRGQIFSPAVAAIHSGDQEPLWTLGAPASPELAMVAEDAMSAALVDKLQASPHVARVRMISTTSGPIPPGASATGILEANPGRFRRLSLVGMLVSTNDAFYGLDGIDLPREGSAVHLAPGYDAGSEANTEKCAHIPGPPCGNAGVRVTAGAEGFVHVHAGVHGIGDLEDSRFDWRNPVAKVEVRRLR